MNQPKPIDYRDLLKEDEPADGSQTIDEEETNLLPEDKQRFSLDGLKDWWLTADSRTKWEVIALIVVLILTISVFSYYISGKISKPRINEDALLMEEDMLMEELLFEEQGQ